jgi:hypothetical protein
MTLVPDFGGPEPICAADTGSLGKTAVELGLCEMFGEPGAVMLTAGR